MIFFLFLTIQFMQKKTGIFDIICKLCLCKQFISISTFILFLAYNITQYFSIKNYINQIIIIPLYWIKFNLIVWKCQKRLKNALNYCNKLPGSLSTVDKQNEIVWCLNSCYICFVLFKQLPSRN